MALIGPEPRASAETVLARRPRGAAATPTAEQILRERGFPDFWCYGGHCVVSVDDALLSERLQALDRPDLLDLEPLPDARRLSFARGTFDADTRTVDSTVPGLGEVPSGSPTSLFAVVFKAYPEAAWLSELRAAGLVPLEPMPAMGYLVWGDRAVVTALPAARRWVRTVYEVPAGLKRFRVDTLPRGDEGGAAVTTVHVVDAAGSAVLDLLGSLGARPPQRALQTGTITAWSARLTPQQAIELSRRPDVVAVARETYPVEPSDERTNRIVGGTFRTPGTSWPETVGTNTAPYYWEGFMASLASIGVDPSRQTIGFLDTGVDEALFTAGPTANCPPHLGTTSDCRLVFTTDASEDFDDLTRRADDWRNHGSAVTAVAGGRNAPDRDYRGWAFDHGVAPGVNVAMNAILRTGCSGQSNAGRGSSLPSSLDLADFGQLFRYSMVEMTAVGALPGRVAAPSPPVRVFNHSWNRVADEGFDGRDYDLVAQLVDQTARDLSAAKLQYGQPPDPPVWYAGATGAGALHVLAAGNRVPPTDDMPLDNTGVPEVFSPGNAKNGLTVGATRTDDPRTCTPDLSYSGTYGCWGAENLMGSNPRVVAGFSRIGFPNNRLKPDLVAPGSRVYGRLTQRNWLCDSCLVRYAPPCTLAPPINAQEKTWMRGTSFAAPAVSGAAALVRDWLGTAFGRTDPSSALLRSVLIVGARNLVPWREAWGSCCDGPTNCWPCGDMRPSPDKYQGWGGLSFDRLFGTTNRYYLRDQATTFTSPGQVWSKTLTITDRTRPITVFLTWTDRASTPVVDSYTNNLVNDLDLTVTTPTEPSQKDRAWQGNVYYCDRDALGPDRTGYSLDDDMAICKLRPDRKNNAEKIDIDPARIPPEATTITVTVSAVGITADGVDVFGFTPRQDFALAVENAHE